MIFIYFGQSVDLNTNKLIPKQLANKLDHVFVNMKYDYLFNYFYKFYSQLLYY